MSKKQIILGILGAVVAVLALIIISFASVSNRQINQQQTVITNKANIQKEEERRVDLFNNLVDAVQSYNKYESGTQDKIAKARSKASKGNVDGATKALNVVVERYPQLKSQSNYKNAMTEFSLTENRLSNYREAYNTSVRDYNSFVSRFPNKQILGMTGHSTQHYKTLHFKVDNAKALNLFD